MPRKGTKLTKAEEEALQTEARRIAELGNAWRPDEKTLRELVEVVKKAGAMEYREAQSRGIAAARERGVRLGRPKKEKPASFPAIAEAIDEGRMTRIEAAAKLGISCETLRRWLAGR